MALSNYRKHICHDKKSNLVEFKFYKENFDSDYQPGRNSNLIEIQMLPNKTMVKG